MRFGLRLPSFALGEDTASLAEMGAYLRRAEDLGFESAMLIDHLLVAPPAYRTTWLEPVSLLSALSGVTRTIRLGTLVLVLPFRDPVAFAKEWATLDVLSGGRSILGVGVGWHEGEFATLRIPFKERGRRMNEMLEAITALWAGDHVTYEGQFYRFEDLTLEPKPAPAAASADLDRGRDAAVREDLRPDRRHDPAGPAPDREVRLHLGAALLGDGRDGRLGLGDHPRGDGGVRARPGRDDQGLLELHPRPGARRGARDRRPRSSRSIPGWTCRTGRSSTCSARPSRWPSGSAARSRPSVAWSTSSSTRSTGATRRSSGSRRTSCRSSGTDRAAMGSYLRPASLDEALAALAAGPRTLLAGGTDIYPARVGRVRGRRRPRRHRAAGPAGDPHRRRRLADPGARDLDGPRADGPAAALRRAEAPRPGRSAGSRSRTAATICGNVCNASPAADGLPNLIALDARVELASADGPSRGPGRRLHDRQPPDRPPAGRARDGRCSSRSRPARPGRRSSSSARGPTSSSRSRWSRPSSRSATTDGSSSARIVVGACSEVPQRIPAAEARLVGRRSRRAGGRGRPIEPADLAGLAPIDDVRAPAAYRREAALVLVRRAIAELAPMTPARPTFRVNGADVSVLGDPMRRLTEVLRDDLGPDRDEGRLRRRRLRRVHGPAGRRPGLRLPRAARPARPAATWPRSRAWPTATRLRAGPGRLPVRRGRPVRDLHAGHAHGGRRAARDPPAPDRGAGPGRARRRPLPLHRLPQDRRGGPDRVGDARRRRWPTRPAAGAAVGARIARVDGVDQVTGATRFGADEAPADALDAPGRPLAARPCPVHARRPRRPPRRASRARPRPASRPTSPGVNRYGIYATGKDQQVLADGYVRYRGEAVVALVGDAETVARIARRRGARSPGTPLPPLLDLDAAARPGRASSSTTRSPGNLLAAGRVVRGDVEAALAASAVVASGTFETVHVEHAYIEPEAGYAERAWRPDRGLRVSTQTPYMDRDEIALIMGFEPERVQVIPSACGGGLRRQAGPVAPAARRDGGLDPRSAGPLRLHAPGVDARDDQAASGADPGLARGRRGRPPDRDRLPRRLRHRRLRVVGPDRRQPRAGPRQRAVCRAGRPRHDPGDLHERPDRRGVPRLRRAAGGHRPGGPARRPGRPARAWTGSRSGSSTRFAPDPRRRPARSSPRAPGSPPASRRCGRPGMRATAEAAAANAEAAGADSDPPRRRRSGPCGTASATRRCPIRRRSGSACGGTARTSCSAARRRSARARTRS